MNWDKLTRVTAPATTTLTLDDVKAHLRVVSDDQDDLITSLMAVAESFLDGPWGIGVPLITQTWRLSLDFWPAQIILPMRPVQSINSITYTDIAGASHTVNPTIYTYDLDANPVRIMRAYSQVWPSDTLNPVGAIKVNFSCGYGSTPASVPADLLHAQKLLIGHLFANTDAVVGLDGRVNPVDMPFSVDYIFAKYRPVAIS